MLLTQFLFRKPHYLPQYVLSLLVYIFLILKILISLASRNCIIRVLCAFLIIHIKKHVLNMKKSEKKTK